VTLETTPAPALAADELTTLRADVAALEFIFDELARAMDPAALLKVLTYLIRNAKRVASETQSYDSLEHRRLVAQVESLMAPARGNSPPSPNRCRTTLRRRAGGCRSVGCR